jgi:hypothetical protein
MRALFLGLFVSLLMLAGCSSSSSSDGGSDITVPVLADTTASVDENATSGSYVGTIDIDDGGSAITSIVLSGTGAAEFSVANDGTVTVTGTLDFETTSAYALTAVATNAAGVSIPVNVAITVNNVDEIVAVLQNINETVSENATVGTVVADYLLADHGSFEVTGITLSGTGSEDFSVSPEGIISVANAPLIYGTVYNLSAVATSGAGDSLPVDVNITVSTPPTLQPFTATINETTTSGTPIGDINISDYGSADVTSITLTGTGEGDFSVEPVDGTISAAANMDFYAQGLYLLQAVAHSTAGDSDPVPVTILVDHKLDGGGAANDHFGSSVAVSGDVIVVGAQGDVTKPGSAIVYAIDPVLLSPTNGEYIEVATLTPGDGQPGDRFGISVAIDGNNIVVGAQLQDNGDANTSADYGAAYVYTFNPGGGLTSPSVTYETKLTADDNASQDHYGFSVAVGGDLIVVGADNKGGETGAAYVYSISGGYSEVAEMTGDPFSNFGWSVGVSGGNVVVGAPYADTAGNGSGSVFVFSSDGAELYELTASDAQANDHLGWSVAIDGSQIVAGAPGQDLGDANTSINFGAAYVFATDGSPVAKLVSDAPEADGEFGRAIDISGNSVIVGAEQEDPADDLTGNFGYAYLFENDGANNFSQVARFNGYDTVAGDSFGHSVAIDGTNAAAGAVDESHVAGEPESGAAYLFNLAQ